MFAPLPPLGRLTEGLLIVSEDVPLLRGSFLFFLLSSTSSARGVGGGGAIGGGVGEGILGLPIHIII